MQPTPDMSILSTVQDELRDMRRVQQYGQEEDLKDALGRMIQRVEEFVSSSDRDCLFFMRITKG